MALSKGNNKAVFDKLIAGAGGVERARFVILPTASASVENGRRICEELGFYGIPSDRAQLLNVCASNTSSATRDPAILEMMRSATAVYMIGGKQLDHEKLFFRYQGRELRLTDVHGRVNEAILS